MFAVIRGINPNEDVTREVVNVTIVSLLIRLVISVAIVALVWLWFEMLTWYERLREGVALKQQIEILLPNSIEILALYMAVGLDLGEAVRRAALVMPEPGRTEFTLIAQDLQFGIPVGETMSKFANRTGCQDGQALSLLFQQADRFGNEIVSKLHQLASALRERRLADLEKATKSVPIKILIPLVIFIFPSVMIVMLTPVLIKSGLLR